MQYKDYREKRELRTMAIHALAHMTEYKGSNKLKQWFPKWAVPPLGGGEKL